MRPASRLAPRVVSILVALLSGGPAAIVLAWALHDEASSFERARERSVEAGLYPLRLQVLRTDAPTRATATALCGAIERMRSWPPAGVPSPIQRLGDGLIAPVRHTACNFDFTLDDELTRLMIARGVPASEPVWIVEGDASGVRVIATSGSEGTNVRDHELAAIHAVSSSTPARAPIALGDDFRAFACRAHFGPRNIGVIAGRMLSLPLWGSRLAQAMEVGGPFLVPPNLVVDGHLPNGLPVQIEDDLTTIDGSIPPRAGFVGEADRADRVSFMRVPLLWALPILAALLGAWVGARLGRRARTGG